MDHVVAARSTGFLARLSGEREVAGYDESCKIKSNLHFGHNSALRIFRPFHNFVTSTV